MELLVFGGGENATSFLEKEIANISEFKSLDLKKFKKIVIFLNDYDDAKSENEYVSIISKESLDECFILNLNTHLHRFVIDHSLLINAIHKKIEVKSYAFEKDSAFYNPSLCSLRKTILNMSSFARIPITGVRYPILLGKSFYTIDIKKAMEFENVYFYVSDHYLEEDIKESIVLNQNQNLKSLKAQAFGFELKVRKNVTFRTFSLSEKNNYKKILELFKL